MKIKAAVAHANAEPFQIEAVDLEEPKAAARMGEGWEGRDRKNRVGKDKAGTGEQAVSEEASGTLQFFSKRLYWKQYSFFH